jgi:transcriptional regulator with XRE-family HTH domain
VESLFGAQLLEARGDQNRRQFARRLGLSYTFVTEMERGNRLPSDQILMNIAQQLELDPQALIVAAYSDRSPILRRILADKGLIRDGRIPDRKGPRSRSRPRAASA